MEEEPKRDRQLESIHRFFNKVSLYNDLSRMEKAIDVLRSRGFVVHEFDCRELHTRATVLNGVLQRLGLLGPSHYWPKMSMDSFWSELCGVEVPEKTGLLLVFKNFEIFHREDPQCAQGMMESIARVYSRQLTDQKRFTACAHSNDPDLKLETLDTITIEAERTKEDFDQEAKDALGAKIKSYISAMNLATDILGSRLGLELHLDDISSLIEKMNAGEGRKTNLDLSANEMVDLFKDFDFETQLREAGRNLEEARNFFLWADKLQSLYNAQSEMKQHRYQIVRSMFKLTRAKNNEMLAMKTTPEEAIHLLKSLPAKEWAD